MEEVLKSTAKDLSLLSIELFSGDIYQTLVTCSNQARFGTKSDGDVVYVLDHPNFSPSLAGGTIAPFCEVQH